MNRGFTIVELVVSIAIFAFMTALVTVKYGAFNNSTLLTDTAYDIALAVHTAQNYGLSVKNASAGFSAAYGINLSTSASYTCGSSASGLKKMVIFADTTVNGLCTSADVSISTYALTHGASITHLCSGTGPGAGCTSRTRLDVSFLRPDPEATICGDGTCSGQTYAEIRVSSGDGSTRSVSVSQNGRVSVLQI